MSTWSVRLENGTEVRRAPVVTDAHPAYKAAACIDELELEIPGTDAEFEAALDALSLALTLPLVAYKGGGGGYFAKGGKSYWDPTLTNPEPNGTRLRQATKDKYDPGKLP